MQEGNKKELKPGRKPKEKNYDTPFAKRLRQLLDDYKTNRGTSLEEVARKIKVTRQSLGQYKDGNNIPDIITFQKLAEYFNVSYEYLFGETEVKSIKDDIKIACKTTGLSEESIKNFMQTKDSGNSEFSQAQDWLITNEILEIMSCICIHIKINSENFINQKTEHHKMNGMERISHNMSLYNAEDSCDVERYKLTKLMESVANNFDKRCSESNNQT